MNTTPMIEVTLLVATSDEATAANAAEVMSRLLVGLAAENVYASIAVEKHEQVCDHEHDEVGP